MATHSSALKRERQAEKRRERNRRVISHLRSLIKKIDIAVEEKKTEDAKTILAQAISSFHKAASKGVIHKNNAARKISHLTIKINKILALEPKEGEKEVKRTKTKKVAKTKPKKKTTAEQSPTENA